MEKIGVNKLSLQEYLSLGYLYLLVLGLLTDTIYYGLLDLNILDYSSISDVLISPLKLLARNMIVFLAFLLILVMLFVFGKWVHPRLAKAVAKGKEVKVITQETLVAISALMVIGYFLGLGIGLGIKTSTQMEEGRIRPDHQIIFSDQKSQDVKIVGRNSIYIFYILKGGKQVYTTPIDGNVFVVKKLL